MSIVFSQIKTYFKIIFQYCSGFLKGDKLLCSCSVKLNPLSNTSTIHDAFDVFLHFNQLIILFKAITTAFLTFSFFNYYSCTKAENILMVN